MTISRNQISVCHSGIKTMHGGRNVMITDNLIERADDEGIYLGAGNAFRATPARDGLAARPVNHNHGCLVANNLITDLGRGLEAWALWQPGPPANSPVGIKIAGMSDGELLRDYLVITGNLIYDGGQDFATREMPSSAEVKPHFKYAVWIEPETAARLRHVRFTGNLFPAGEHGVSNVDLSRWP